MAPIQRALAVAGLAVLLAACTQTKAFLGSETVAGQSGPSRVLLMPPDIELSELTAAGLLEPNAAWTATARSNVNGALATAMARKNAQLVHYEPQEPGSTYDEAHVQFVKLHGAVGQTILVHKYIQGFELPTKRDRFDWGLGEGVAALQATYEADYALFVYLRDSFASGGRVALIFVGALFGVGVPGGSQVGFASLVDLRTGDVVWFNRLVSGTGDLRKPDLAEAAIEQLLSDIPL